MKCPYCGSEQTITYFNAQMPNILAACSEEMLEKVKTFPLEVKLCKNCLLGFNSTKLNEEELKLIYDNYIYISPLQGIGVSKYQDILATLKKYYGHEDKLVEIGCSEGFLLSQLNTDGYINLIGIEPGPQALHAKSIGLNIIQDYYDKNTFLDMDIDGFYLMHVFEHFSNPFAMLDIMVKHLSSNGKIIIEVPDFDGYHHQHLFFYNIPFMIRLCKDKGLFIIEATISMHALRIVAVHANNLKYKNNVIHMEDSLFNIEERAEQIHLAFLNKVNSLNELFKKYSNSTIHWWGAGSASVIYLNQIRPEVMDNVDLVLVDGDQNKWENYIPGMGIEVRSNKVIQNTTVDVMVIASSFHKEIKATMKNLGIEAKHFEIIE